VLIYCFEKWIEIGEMRKWALYRSQGEEVKALRMAQQCEQRLAAAAKVCEVLLTPGWYQRAKKVCGD
jgi:hypothetical protein